LKHATLIISSTTDTDASKAEQAKRTIQRDGFVAATQHLIIDEILAVYKVSDATSLANSLYIEASHSRMDTIAAASLLFHFYRKGKHYSLHYSHGLPPQISQCAFQSSLQWHRCRRTAPELESNYLFIFFNHWNHM